MRTSESSIVTTVRHVASPLGRARENGPHLGDLRRFLEQCAGLPDEVLVRIDMGQLGESGRRDVTFSATHRLPLAAAASADCRSTYPFRAPGEAVTRGDDQPATPVLPPMDAEEREFHRVMWCTAARRWDELMATEGPPGLRREPTDG